MIEPDFEAASRAFAVSRGFAAPDAAAAGDAALPDAPTTSRGMGIGDAAPAPVAAPGLQTSAPVDDRAPPASTPAAPAPAASQQPPDERLSLLDKMAKKDALVHEERARVRELQAELQQLKQRQEQEQQQWRTDPVAALHSRGVTQQMLNERFLGLPSAQPGAAPNAQPGAPAAPVSTLPPELAQEIEALRQWRQQEQQRAQQSQRQAAEQSARQILQGHLGNIGDFALLNELGDGAYDQVLAEVRAHTRGQPFDDDEQAATIIQAVAHRVQTREQERLRTYLGKPGVRAFLDAEMQKSRGTRTPAPRQPVRQEPEDPTPARAVAREQLDYGLAQQRSLRPAPDQGWDKDAAMRAFLAEASELKAQP